MWNRYYCPHLTQRKTEAKRGFVSYLRPHIEWWLQPLFDFKLFDFNIYAMLLLSYFPFSWRISNEDVKKIIILTSSSCFTILILRKSNQILISTKVLQGNCRYDLLYQLKKKKKRTLIAVCFLENIPQFSLLVQAALIPCRPVTGRLALKLARPLGKMIPTFLKYNCFGKISLIESLENLYRLKFPGTLWSFVCVCGGGVPISNDLSPGLTPSGSFTEASFHKWNNFFCKTKDSCFFAFDISPTTFSLFGCIPEFPSSSKFKIPTMYLDLCLTGTPVPTVLAGT